MSRRQSQRTIVKVIEIVLSLSCLWIESSDTCHSFCINNLAPSFKAEFVSDKGSNLVKFQLVLSPETGLNFNSVEGILDLAFK